MALIQGSKSVPRPDGYIIPLVSAGPISALSPVGHAQKTLNTRQRAAVSVRWSNQISALLFAHRSWGWSPNSVQTTTLFSQPLRLRLVTLKWRQTWISDHVLSDSKAQGYTFGFERQIRLPALRFTFILKQLHQAHCAHSSWCSTKLTNMLCCPISHQLDPGMDTFLCMKQQSTHLGVIKPFLA